MLKKVLLFNGVVLTAGLLWFAAVNYSSSVPLAEENLQGVALSLAAAVQSAANHDPGLDSLAGLRTNDLAFMSIVDDRGTIRFHSNSDLIGTETKNRRYLDILRSGKPLKGRIALGTGERAYEFVSPLNLSEKTVVLHLALHTYRADAAVRQARINLAILLTLIAMGWILSFIIYRFAVREEVHQRELARRENLARLGEMGAILAHEIRNPLGGIKGFAQVIVKKPAEERNSGFARQIVDETVRLETLVNDLLSYARTDSYEKGVVDVSEMIDSAAALIGPEAGQRSITIRKEIEKSLRLSGNRDRLGQVILNLLNNALQAVEAGGTIDIDARRSGKMVVITVTDDGTGIEPEQLDKIYDPFYTTKAKGTGLGLSLCRKTVEEHGGSVEIKSAPGKGTSVILHFPGLGPEHDGEHA